MPLPLSPPIVPMLAKAVPEIRPGRIYEPKFDGFRAIVFRDGDHVEIGSRKERPLTRYFPEVASAALAGLPERCVVDGEIVITTDGRLDFWSLQQRLHPAASRVDMLAAKTPAELIAFDLLALGDEDLTGRPFAERRARLEAIVAPPVHLTPVTTDLATARRWFDAFEGAGLDGLIAKDPAATYQPGVRAMEKIKHERTADCVVAGYRLHKSGPDAVGSLLLGLHDDGTVASWFGEPGGLRPIGVAASFPMPRRRALLAELAPHVIDIAEHPWGWAGDADDARGGVGSRWNPDKSLAFVPLRPELVAEVRYDHMDGARLRHPARFLRWRPDRDAASCGFAQLERPASARLEDALRGHLEA